MKRRPLQWKVFSDEGGQALTEFVIVIPIVLLFFFAMLQYFSIVQATQLGNYAAFVAARAYAVDNAADTNADSEAQTAASIVMATIARPAINEIGGFTGFGNDVSTIQSDLSSLGGDLGTGGQDVVNFGMGYLMANYVRFNSKLLGGSVSCSLTNYSGGPTQVVVSINYPQPIYVPGLASMWKFLGGSNIYASLNGSAQGLTGISGQLLPIYAGTSSLQSDVSELSQYDSGLGSSIQSFISSLPTVLLPYVNIQSECAIGYSAWSGSVREPHTVSDSSPTNSSPVNQEAQAFQQAQSDQANYTNACNTASQTCSTMGSDYNSLQAAQAAYNANPSSQNQTNLNAAQNAYNSSVTANTTAQNNVTTWENAVNGDYDTLQNLTGQSMQHVQGVDCKCCPPQ